MKKKTFVLATLTVLLGATFAFSSDLFNRGKYESAAYEVVETDGKFEVRKYPELVVVTAPMSARSENNDAFRKLFRYISGKNESGEKIAMTTPVFTTPKDGKKSDSGVMAFVVPKEVAQSGAPKANNDSVAVTKRPAGKFAVYRYSGRWTKARETQARKTLEEWLKKSGIKPVGVFEKANYDPPFTPGFLRRNEVLVRIK